ncbi:MAG: alpha/beta hydrolase [Candidatus Pelagibacter sp.]|nr:alpha/beta hydrolase [Candidatus Pelagibacter sp.]OUW23439.1 MAG: alpha/beta hydrolase [Rickettsiales bacterium TMED174]|tara:strand:- start:380 stop:1054 length:675 start_codon:yes stop_codon:yes gene_type:complete
MSDIEGEKPRIFRKYAIKKKLGFLALEYSGHGKSSGEFIKGNISKWTKDTKILIKKVVRKNNFILIGSSMGAWISLNQFKYFKKQIMGFIGIGSAPEFLERLMWNKFSKKIKEEIIQNGVSVVKHGKPNSKQGHYEYPVTYQLIKDGRKNKVLSKKIKFKKFVTVFHGQKDEVVPVIFSKKVLSLFPNAQKKITIIKKGDHSLSQKKNLNIILKEINRLVSKFY